MLRSFIYISLVCLLLINSLQISAQETTPAVLDTAGRPIISNTRYYILPAGINKGGGPTLVSHNGSCPSYLGQDKRVSSQGLPVIFIPYSPSAIPLPPSIQTLRESTDFTIRFNVTTIATCVGSKESAEWALLDWPPATGRMLMKTITHGMGSLFKIERNGKHYKLIWCPSNLCPRCTPRCGDIGVYVENKVRLLALYEPALSVVFKRA